LVSYSHGVVDIVSYSHGVVRILSLTTSYIIVGTCYPLG